ncbi:MAG: DegV family protein [Dehalococcoidales bacterium]|jgi:DegV family protein with EDD domain|nr:DegV family protein [Dehalococcoidales bacterium]MDD5604591.1 DegV family protein [Dehalococcoidales bacterium]MDX9986297.1 DegV family protein [Dehalococcoidales bacterium]NLE90074.1 DegV family protein [Dehalococcoidales bacterium]
MTVKIVTDSTSDIPASLAEKMGITVVPVHVFFGKESYLDGVNITPSIFYQKLESSSYHPTTSQPALGDFISAYNNLMTSGADGILSVHISSKISGAFSSAQRAAEICGREGNIKVLDSGFNSIGLGLVAIAAAKIAQAGESLQAVVEGARKAIAQIDMYGIFDTLKYVVRGGRISKTKATVASIIGVKPMLKFSDGAILQGGLARTYNKGIEKLVEFVKNKTGIISLAIAHSAVPEDAKRLKKVLGRYFSEEEIIITELGPALGAHGGPGVLLVAVQSQ